MLVFVFSLHGLPASKTTQHRDLMTFLLMNLDLTPFATKLRTTPHAFYNLIRALELVMPDEVLFVAEHWPFTEFANEFITAYFDEIGGEVYSGLVHATEVSKFFVPMNTMWQYLALRISCTYNFAYHRMPTEVRQASFLGRETFGTVV